jgi:hypothetical protein
MSKKAGPKFSTRARIHPGRYGGAFAPVIAES